MRFGRPTRKILTVLFIGLNLFFTPMMMFIPAIAFAEGNHIVRWHKNSESIDLVKSIYFFVLVTKFNVQVINIIVSYVCVIYT